MVGKLSPRGNILELRYGKFTFSALIFLASIKCHLQSTIELPLRDQAEVSLYRRADPLFLWARVAVQPLVAMILDGTRLNTQCISILFHLICISVSFVPVACSANFYALLLLPSIVPYI
jgi:hypothetical protein